MNARKDEKIARLKGMSVYTKYKFMFALTSLVVLLSQAWIADKIYILQNRKKAEALVNKSLSFVDWIASHGGVWVVKGNDKNNNTGFEAKLQVDGQEYNVRYKTPAESFMELIKTYNSVNTEAHIHVMSTDQSTEETLGDDHDVWALQSFFDQLTDLGEGIKDIKMSELFYEIRMPGYYRYSRPLLMGETCSVCFPEDESLPPGVNKNFNPREVFSYERDDMVGIISVTIPSDYMSLFTSFFGDVVFAVIALIMVVVYNFLWFRYMVSQPIRKLTAYASRLSKREYNSNIDIKSRDEFGLMAWTMQFMSKDIGDHINNLEENKKEIEQNSKHLEQVNTTFERFVPREFLSFLGHADIININLGDQVQYEMTVFFSDIRGFTKLSEKMSPRENFNFLNTYLQTLGPLINKNNGFIDKYIGDAIMALFPGAVDDAVHASIQIQEALMEYNKERKKDGLMPIQTGIGLHYGHLMLGTIGYDQHMQGTVISDAVNLASRIESLTKDFGSNLLISGSVLRALINRDNYDYRFLGKVSVKGKDERILIYEIFDFDEEELREFKRNSKSDFEYAVELFSDEDYKKARDIFGALLKINVDDQAAQVYYNKCQEILEPGERGMVIVDYTPRKV